MIEQSTLRSNYGLFRHPPNGEALLENGLKINYRRSRCHNRNRRAAGQTVPDRSNSVEN